MDRTCWQSAALVAAVITAAAGCSIIKSNTEAQTLVTQQVAGMPAGDFFEQYGRWRTRAELPSGGVAYNWDSSVGSAPPGPDGLDERVCKLRLIADKGGRIETASIVLDNPGRVSTSRCGEMFKAR